MYIPKQPPRTEAERIDRASAYCHRVMRRRMDKLEQANQWCNVLIVIGCFVCTTCASLVLEVML